jgi:hypothetical protein
MLIYHLSSIWYRVVEQWLGLPPYNRNLYEFEAMHLRESLSYGAILNQFFLSLYFA